MNKLIILLSLICVLFIGGCASPAARQNKQISYLVGLENKEIAASRYDLLKKTQANLQRLVPVTKSKIVVSSLHGTIFKSGEVPNTVVVLPEGTGLQQVVDANSAEIAKVINSSTANKAAEQKDEKIISDSDTATTKIIAAIDYEKAHPPHGWFWWILHIGSGLGIVGVIALVICCFMFPAILPIILGILKDLYEVMTYLLGIISNWFKK